jgi:hypothetical protein
LEPAPETLVVLVVAAEVGEEEEVVDHEKE